MLYIPVVQMFIAKGGQYPGAIFIQKHWSRTSLFLEGIPPAWLLWYKLESYIYKPLMSSKPTEEEGWFKNKVRLLVDVIRWENEFVVKIYSYKFIRLKPAIIIWIGHFPVIGL